MHRFAAAIALGALLATPALAELKPGTRAPDFTAPAFLAGKPFTYSLSRALRNGPVVLYFFPSAYTKGCNIEARLFSEAIGKFQAQKASVVGVTAGKVEQLASFSKDTEHCGGKFPVAADPGAKIARQYDAPLKLASITVPKDLSARTSYVIAPDGRILLAYDNLDPSDHVNQTLKAVTAWRAEHGK